MYKNYISVIQFSQLYGPFIKLVQQPDHVLFHNVPEVLIEEYRELIGARGFVRP